MKYIKRENLKESLYSQFEKTGETRIEKQKVTSNRLDKILVGVIKKGLALQIQRKFNKQTDWHTNNLIECPNPQQKKN